MRKLMLSALLLGGLSLAACQGSQPAPASSQPSVGAPTPMAAPAAPAAPSKGACGGGGKA